MIAREGVTMMSIPMKRRCWVSVSILLIGATLARAQSESKVDVTGTWLFDVQTDAGSGTPTFIFKQDGGKLTGTYKGQFGEAPLTGTVKGNAISYEFQIDVQGQVATFNYDGTIEKDTMKGTMRIADLAEGTFTAKRQ
jgi:hypothetical protein